MNTGIRCEHKLVSFVSVLHSHSILYINYTHYGTQCMVGTGRFGHQDKITDIDVLSQERVVTSGARDSSIRIWKIAEESQLVFHGHRLVIV